MYPTKAEASVIQAAEQLMKKTMARYDPSHDAYHVERVRKTALSLARSISSESASQKQPDLLTVELAALLHDVLDKKYVSAEEAADPYSYFLPFFRTWAQASQIDFVSDGRAKEIAKIVDNVSWSTEKKRRQTGEWGTWHDECLELHCVQDADRLDAIGAFGIMRCSAFSAATNRALHIPVGAPGFEESAIQHFHDKLLHIRERLKTEPGRQLGQNRHQLMLDFLEAVDEEYDVQS
ncbi:hypothetical protein GLOTRDRAFT_95501 [Gloeophyllum trabeum ATCC 11539]|uniref:HD/PDEase domain-containing protein n=1 Tax=Gloeophyllum trabeum (strain ATCC 11539 / FP-39264 / Madison 617) TaxID=670483 RepID=S7PYA4_GLOTA|nr:uncharacterized protein GLOTRDRAFT_95501 [Gloeophyllum trabeum ATCC 11539]EPQ52621.1 hypothetical protein GLOTRDRAFT_95501 [Gloeophyllum trabeum ATCC 11539]